VLVSETQVIAKFEAQHGQALDRTKVFFLVTVTKKTILQTNHIQISLKKLLEFIHHSLHVKLLDFNF
jgi:hypothetical protein